MGEYSDRAVIGYPGGKWRARKTIVSRLPLFLTEMVAPFFGAGSVEWYMASKGTKVYASDVNKDLVNFWRQMLKDPKPIADYCQPQVERNLELSEYKQLHEELKRETNPTRRAAMYCAASINSFGARVGCGGRRLFGDRPVMTTQKIKAIREFRNENVHLELLDFEEALDKRPNAFAYMDPPYFGTEDLYDSGTFDHERLRAKLDKRQNWLMTYGDCKEIRELYKGFPIIVTNWIYDFNRFSEKSSDQLIIFSKDRADEINRTKTQNQRSAGGAYHKYRTENNLRNDR